MTNQGNYLKIDGNLNRPEVTFDGDTGQFVISGRSILENTVNFYEPILNWIDMYCQKPAARTELHLKMDYFNTSTSKYLLTLIDKLAEIYNEGSDVVVLWYYVDEDMKELGEDYSEVLGVPFQLLDFSEKK